MRQRRVYGSNLEPDFSRLPQNEDLLSFKVRMAEYYPAKNEIKGGNIWGSAIIRT